tara:strand:- start:52 stop:525 length:474 start_codon:yes stop_codon:yes gene_type:complete
MAKDRPLFIMGAHQRWFEAISSVLGEPSLVADPRFATQKDREANREALRTALEERLAQRTAAEWEAELTGAGVPASEVRVLSDVVASRHVQERGSVFTVPVSQTDVTRLVSGLPYQFSEGGYRTGPVPALGEHTRGILEQLGLSANEIDDLEKQSII